MKKSFFLFLMMVFAIGNAQAYDFMAMSPSHHVLYLNIVSPILITVAETIITIKPNPKVTLSFPKRSLSVQTLGRLPKSWTMPSTTVR